MICPNCSMGVALFFEESVTWKDKDYERTAMGIEFAWDQCPECGEPIIILRHGKYVPSDTSEHIGHLEDVSEEQILYPRHVARKVEPGIPDSYKSEFLEACSILSLSPKASAALSRRILQRILREEFDITYPSLAKEIDDFIQLKDVPSYLTEAVDAIRNIGNFAAHPLKDTNTGEIVDVESGEAEWLLEVLEALFDFVFIQPKKLEERRKSLNEKLQALGKPPMKG